MKKTFVRVLAAIAAVCSLAALFAFAGCNKKKPEETKYTVTYAVGEGATGTAPAGGEFEAGATFALPAATGLAKEDYTFEAWNDGAADYAVGATFTMPAKNVTFTAKWKANQVEPPVPVTYTVTFAKGAEDATGTAPTLAAQASGAAVTLPANTFTYEGHTFKGWKASTDNQVYQPEATYTMTAANVTFTAQWEANGEEPPVPVTQYTVTFVLNNEEANQTATVDEGDTVTKPSNPVHPDGKVFMYWADSNGEYDFDTPVTGNLELEAVYGWKLIFLAGEGATGTVKPIVAKSYAFVNLPDGTGLSNGDKTFDGWTDGTVNYVAGERYRVSQNVTFTAKWKTNEVDPPVPSTKYDITFKSGVYSITVGTPTMEAQESGTAVTLPANAYVRPHYTFAGWKASTDSQVYQPEETYTMTAEAVTFTAQWTANTVTVLFNANGGSGEMANMTGTFGKSFELSTVENIFTAPQGKEFAGWATSADGQPVSGGLSLNAKTVSSDDTVTLYAIWVDPPVDIATFAGTWTNAGGDEVIISGSGENGTMLYKGQAVIPVISMSGCILAATEDYSYYLTITVGDGTLTLLDAMTETSTVLTNKAATVNAEASVFAGKWSGANRFWYIQGDKVYYRPTGANMSYAPVTFTIIGDYAMYNITASNSFLLKKGDGTMTGYNLYDAERGPVAVTFNTTADAFFVLTVGGEVTQLVAANNAPAAITAPTAPAGQKFDHWVLAGTETVFDATAAMTADASITAVFVDEGGVESSGKTYVRGSSTITFDNVTGTLVENGTTYAAERYGANAWNFSGSAKNPWGMTQCYITVSEDGNTLYVWDYNTMDPEDLKYTYTAE